jgi:hypothetical protein
LTVIREHYICTTADLLPFRAGGFDTVLCTDTLTHIPEPFLERSVREMMCVCAGSLVLAIDCADPTKEGHLTMRPRSWWLERLSALGLNPLPDQDSRLVGHPDTGLELIICNTGAAGGESLWPKPAMHSVPPMTTEIIATGLAEEPLPTPPF